MRIGLHVSLWKWYNSPPAHGPLPIFGRGLCQAAGSVLDAFLRGGVQSVRRVMSSRHPVGAWLSSMSCDAVSAEDDLRHMAGELFSEERRGEVHLVGLYADDAELVEEAPSLRAVRLGLARRVLPAGPRAGGGRSGNIIQAAARRRAGFAKLNAPLP